MKYLKGGKIKCLDLKKRKIEKNNNKNLKILQERNENMSMAINYVLVL
jgi:hypothetical protein